MALVPTPIRGELTFARANAANLNSTGDVASFSGLPANIIIDSLEILNWSATPAAILALTLRDASGGGGNSLVGSIVGLNTPITSTALAAAAYPVAAVLGATRKVVTSALYVNVSVANGSALTADILISYRDVS